MKAVFELRTRQVVDGKAEEFCQRAEGEFIRENGCVRLCYAEPGEDGRPGTQTKIEVADGSVRVERGGGVETEIVYAPGRRHGTRYQTPYGVLELEFATRELRVSDAVEEDFKLHLAYDIESGGRPVSACELDIRVRALEMGTAAG